jgi:hypothetical protein
MQIQPARNECSSREFEKLGRAGRLHSQASASGERRGLAGGGETKFH